MLLLKKLEVISLKQLKTIIIINGIISVIIGLMAIDGGIGLGTVLTFPILEVALCILYVGISIRDKLKS